MQVKFLKSVVEHLINKQSVSIIDLLVDKKDVNEFLIAKNLGLTINQTRNILYRLSDYGLVSFIRKKDKRKGWYIYFWTLNVYQSLSLLEKKLQNELEKLEAQLKNRKEKRYYFCNTCSIEVTEDVALLNDFTCPECEEVYELNDNPQIIGQIEKEIIKIKKEIKLVSKEKQKEEEKLKKKKERKIKKLEEEKKAKRAAKKTAKKKITAKKKPAKKTAKMKIEAKKKSVKKSSGKKVTKKKKTIKKVSKILGRLKKRK